MNGFLQDRYLQCIIAGDSAVLHEAIKIHSFDCYLYCEMA